MKRFIKILLSTPSRIIFGILISIISLYLAFRSLNFGDILGVFSQVSWTWVVFSFLILILHHFSKTFRWKVLLAQQASQIGIQPLLASLMISQMINLVVPARVGEVTRIQQIGVMGPGRSFVLITLVVEKVFDMVAYGVLFIVLIISISLPRWIHNTGILFLVLAGTLFLVLFLIFKNRTKIIRLVEIIIRNFPPRYRDLISEKIQTTISGFHIIENRKVLIWALFWTTFSWVTSILVNLCLLLAMDLKLPWTAPILILLGLQAGISLPSVPMKVGIFEYICVLVLEIYGVSQVTGLSYGILLHLLVILPILGSGLYFLTISDRIFPGSNGKKTSVMTS